MLVVIVLLARWTGQQIRKRFLTPRPPVVTNIPPEENREASPSSLITTTTSTVSAIPSTGPADFGFVIMGFVFVSGISSLALAHRKS